MIKRGWQQREAAAKAKRFDRENPSEDQITIDAERKAHYWAEQQRQVEAREAERQAKLAPARRIAELFRDRFADDLPEMVEALEKVGTASVIAIMKRLAATQVADRRAAAEESRLAAEPAFIAAERERGLERDRAKAEKVRAAKEQAKANEAP